MPKRKRKPGSGCLNFWTSLLFWFALLAIFVFVDIALIDLLAIFIVFLVIVF